MICPQSVYSLYRQRYGAEGSGEEIGALCDLASAEISAMLSPDADPTDIRALGAAAALALLRYTRRQALAGGEVSSFRAGDISITASQATALTAAREEYSSAFAALAPLIKDGSFYFGQVKI